MDSREKKPRPGCGQVHGLDAPGPAGPADQSERAKRVREEGDRLAMLSAALVVSTADKTLPREAVQAVWIAELFATCIFTRTLQVDKAETDRWIQLVFQLIDKKLTALEVPGIRFQTVSIDPIKEVPHAEA